jgi:Rha family phage regulatory protein
MFKYLHGKPDEKALYLAAYDRLEARHSEHGREEPDDLDPAIIPDDAHALESVAPEPVAEEPELPPLTDPVVHVDGMRVYATALDVAAFFRKRHDHVLDRVREIIALQPDFGLPNFREISYLDSHGRQQPTFEMTRAGFAVAVGGFTGAEALAFRIRYTERFEEMEAALRAQSQASQHPELPTDFVSALKMLVVSEETKARLAGQNAALVQQTAALAAENAALAAKAETLATTLTTQEVYLDALQRLADRSGLILVSDIAKVLKIPRGELFRMLHRAGYIFQRTKPFNEDKGPWLAHEKWVRKGLFDHRFWTDRRPDGTEKERPQLYATGKGAKTIWLLFADNQRRTSSDGQHKLALGMH